MRTRHFSLVFLLTAVFTAPSAMLSAQSSVEQIGAQSTVPSLTYFILDGSRSMWGRIGERTKIEEAKDALITYISKLPVGAQVGLTAYGHRTDSDCADIEEVVTIGEADRPELKDAIKRINPKGKSPISDAILQSAAKIRDFPGSRRVVLISDGVEACDKDPCVTVRSLKAQGIDFTIDVIGLSGDSQASIQLKCVAEAAGGNFRMVADASELLPSVSGASLASIPQAETTNAPAVELMLPSPVAATGVKPVPPPVVIYTAEPTPVPREVEKGKIIFKRDAWLIKPYYWRLIDSKSGIEVAKNSTFEEVVPAGTYLLAWRQYERGSTEIIIKDDVLVLPNRITTVNLNTSLRLNIPGFVKQPSYWGLRDPESKEELVTFRTFEAYLVPPGIYELIWRQYEDRAETLSFGTVIIPEGRMTYVNLESSLRLEWSDWVPDEVYYWGLRSMESGDWVARYYYGFDSQLVPPGSYVLVYRQSEDKSTDSQLGIIEVTPDGETVFTIDTGVRVVSNTPQDAPRSVEFAELDEEKEIVNVVRLDNPALPMPLKAGHYRISYVPATAQAGESVVADEDFVLDAGEFAEINLDALLPGVSADDLLDFSFDEKTGSEEIKEENAPAATTSGKKAPPAGTEPTPDPYPELALP